MKKSTYAIGFFALVFLVSCASRNPAKRRDYLESVVEQHQDQWCKKVKGFRFTTGSEREYVGCETDEHVVIAGWSADWATILGKSIWMATRAKKKPGVLLIRAGHQRKGLESIREIESYVKLGIEVYTSRD